MKRKEKYSRIAFSVKRKLSFSTFYNTVKNVIVYLFRTPVLYSVLVRLLMKY